MSFDSKKVILLEKKYLYVRASLGFQLEGTSKEIIPTNNGFYRFYVDNLSKALGNSYVNVLYDSSDLTFQCFCSELYMDELMSSDSSAIEDVVEELRNNTKKIESFENGVSSAMLSNHEDNVLVHTDINSISDYFIKNIPSSLSYYSGYFYPNYGSQLVDFSKVEFEIDISKAIKFSNYYMIHEHFNCFFKSNSQRLSIYFYLRGKYKFSFDLKCTLKIKCLNSLGEVKYLTFDKYIHTGTDSISFIIDNSSYTILSIDSVVCFDSEFYDFVTLYGSNNSIAHSDFSNNVLTLYSDDFHFGSLSQNFCYDFTGGYIDLMFYYNPYYNFDWFSDCKLTFITNKGDVSFNCSDLQFNHLENSSFVVCTNLPNVTIDGKNITKLLGIKIYKNNEVF